jgi:hypothetical protein
VNTEIAARLSIFYGGSVHRNSVMTIMMQVIKFIAAASDEENNFAGFMYTPLLLFHGLDRNTLVCVRLRVSLRRNCWTCHRESRILPFSPENGSLHTCGLSDVERPEDPCIAILWLPGTVRCVPFTVHFLTSNLNASWSYQPRPFEKRTKRSA